MLLIVGKKLVTGTVPTVLGLVLVLDHVDLCKLFVTVAFDFLVLSNSGANVFNVDSKKNLKLVSCYYPRLLCCAIC
jgi:hypothetical protein